MTYIYIYIIHTLESVGIFITMCLVYLDTSSFTVYTYIYIYICIQIIYFSVYTCVCIDAYHQATALRFTRSSGGACHRWIPSGEWCHECSRSVHSRFVGASGSPQRPGVLSSILSGWIWVQNKAKSWDMKRKYPMNIEYIQQFRTDPSRIQLDMGQVIHEIRM